MRRVDTAAMTASSGTEAMIRLATPAKGEIELDMGSPVWMCGERDSRVRLSGGIGN